MKKAAKFTAAFTVIILLSLPVLCSAGTYEVTGYYYKIVKRFTKKVSAGSSAEAARKVRGSSNIHITSAKKISANHSYRVSGSYTILRLKRFQKKYYIRQRYYNSAQKRYMYRRVPRIRRWTRRVPVTRTFTRTVTADNPGVARRKALRGIPAHNRKITKIERIR